MNCDYRHIRREWADQQERQKAVSYQGDLFETIQARSILDQLLQESRLFHSSKDFKDLLDFVVRLRNFAPFNAMLLQIQKPGLRFAASRSDWMLRFDRTVKEYARPLLIMWPFGPVALVYDLVDTEGSDLPEHVYSFPAKGVMTQDDIAGFVRQLAKVGLNITFIDAGDRKAGAISRTKTSQLPNESSNYTIEINQNHSPNVQFASLAHELGHLFLSHLGADKKLKIPDRTGIEHAQQEIEAESVAYLVCSRHGVESRSHAYLASFVEMNTTIDHVDLYQVMRAAGGVEERLGLNHHSHAPIKSNHLKN